MIEINPNTTVRIIIPKSENSSSDEEQHIFNALSGITSEQIEAFGNRISEQVQQVIEQRKLNQEKIEKIISKNKEAYGDKKKILENLKENYVKVEENVEMMGYKGKKVHIDLPVVGEFEGFKFEYFVSNRSFTKKDFESHSELENKSYSMKEIGELLKAMNRYMKAMGVETDGNMDYENNLKSWEKYNFTCEAGDCLKQITGLNDRFWLSNNDVALKKVSRALWYCCDDVCYFTGFDFDDFIAHLFLRLSD